jgi:transposase
MAIEGATDTAVFRAFVSDVLVPTLRPGDIVVMDNLIAHKNEQTLSLIEAAGASALFLPPYSPDLNPIELMWSKVKAALRANEARTHESLLDALALALDSISASDTRNWFAHCGYNFI